MFDARSGGITSVSDFLSQPATDMKITHAGISGGKVAGLKFNFFKAGTLNGTAGDAGQTFTILFSADSRPDANDLITVGPPRVSSKDIDGDGTADIGIGGNRAITPLTEAGLEWLLGSDSNHDGFELIAAADVGVTIL